MLQKPKLTRQPVGKTLFKMAFPMLAGTFAMNAFNLTDTWFVSKLGTLPLAAMGFSFPVIMFFMCITLGLGIGASAVISNSLGRNNTEEARLITTHTLILSTIVILLISAIGMATINPLFTKMGAGPEVMPFIKQYMTIWYAGVAFVFLPMMANNIMRATGDTVVPSLIMGLSAVLNMILDPIMIFGFMSIPAMGIQGAALATLMARAVSCIVALWFLHKKKGLIKFEIPCLNQMLVSWKEVLKIGLPSSLSSILMPISGAVVMYFISRHGAAAVAACSAAARLEMFAFMIPMTLGASLVPFTGQNFGADRLDRVRQGHRYANGFAFVFGIFTALFFAFFSDFMVQIFSKDPAVLVVLKQYLMIIPLGYGMMEIHRYSGFFLNGMKQPFHATSVNVFRIVVLLVPLSWAGSRYFGLKGIFFARLVTDVISGTTGLVWSYIILKKMKKQHDLCGPGYKEEGIYDISVKTVSASDSVLGPESLPQ